MIAVTFALAHESADFRRLLADRTREVAILHTGVGEKICRQRIAPFLDSQPFDFVISSGFAGGVDPSLGVGDLLLAENFSDPALLARIRRLLPAQVVRLATVDRIVETVAERAQFARAYGAAAVDMETQWIAEACVERKIPFLALRVISDTAAAPFPAPPRVLFDLERQRTSPQQLLGYLLRHPGAIGRLIRFSRQISTARANLAVALDLVLRELGSPPAV
ncbi:MAG: hypothetical protein M3429_07590 [Verrucomicrobiota bacterium]|nr:hypothetical protein [Verrucomicrobiota bacterium]